MNTTRLLIACALTLGLLTQACQDHMVNPAQPGAPALRLRVKSLSEDLPNNTAKITTFSYDSQGRLSGLVAYQTPDSSQANVERSTYQYDGQNRLVRQQRQLITRPNTASLTAALVEAHQFTYNAASQVSEIRFLASYYQIVPPGVYVVDPSLLNSPNALSQLATLRYDQTGQLAGMTKVNYFQGSPALISTANTYSYAGKDLISANTVTFQNGVQFSNVTNTLTYDTQTNPFYGSYVVGRYFGGIGDSFQNLSTLSPHNITKLDGVSYRYDYNSSGLPTVRYTYSDKLIQTLRFTYESY
ncbi:MAG: hypothetical protein EOO39_30100 [Cytophagaceae bacterium]|nr:MAG: hypothetical protein EOO39_30100 [Cytophagaceae bacterium]